MIRDNQKALIVVDVQNDFVTGSLGSKDAEEILPVLSNIVTNIKANKDFLIYYTKDTHYGDYLETFEGKKLPVEHCIRDTDGWRISEYPGVFTTLNSTILYKDTFGIFKYDDITELYLKECSEIVLTGLCTDICVISNALILRAMCPDSNIIIISDATAGTSKVAKEAALLVAKQCQIDIMTSDEYLA